MKLLFSVILTYNAVLGHPEELFQVPRSSIFGDDLDEIVNLRVLLEYCYARDSFRTIYVHFRGQTNSKNLASFSNSVGVVALVK